MTEFDEEKGIEAIIFLQKRAGIVETREQAQAGWRKMKPHQKSLTLEVFERLNPKQEH